MISLKELCEIDQCCREVKNNYDSTFGGISVVVLCGDFYQMPPVSGHALYWNLEGKREIDDMEEEDLRETDERWGKRLWELFDTVVLLTEQMRQAEDAEYHEILVRARAGELKE